MRFIAILLLTLLSFQPLGYLVLILAQVAELRMEMAQFLEKNMPTEDITMTRHEFERARSGPHELYYRNTLFDIVEMRTLADENLVITVIRDEKEEELLNRLGICLDTGQNNAKQHPAGAFFVKILRQIFLLPHETNLPSPVLAAGRNVHFVYLGRHSVFQPFILIPPPRQTGV